MNDDQIRSELERRADSAASAPDWTKRALVPAVWRKIDARPQPVVTSRWPSLAGVAALVAALLILVLAVPRLAPQPPAGSHSQSAFPTPTTPLSASGPTYMCTGPDWEGGAIELTDHLGVIESCLATRGDRLEERTVVSEISRGVVGVAWQGPCADGASLDLWSREDWDDRPRYVLTIESIPLDPPRDCLPIAGIAVEVTFMNAELAPENLATDVEAHLIMSGAASDATEISGGGFNLTLSAEATQYLNDDPIDIQAQLLYEGDQPTIDLSGTFSLVNGFGIEQLDGDLGMGPGWEEPCVSHQLQAGEPLTVPFEKSAGWSQDDPNGDFYRDWSADPVLHLPAGTWLVTAYSDFMVGSGCSGERVHMQASIVIRVVPTPQVAPSPSPGRQLECGVLPPVVIDHTGLVEDCSYTRNPGDSIPWSVSNPAGNPLALEVAWSGVPGCGGPDSLTLRAVSIRYELGVTTTDRMLCDGVVYVTRLTFTLSSPIEASDVFVTHTPGLAPSPTPQTPHSPPPSPSWELSAMGTDRAEAGGAAFELSVTADHKEYMAGEPIEVLSSLRSENDVTVLCLWGPMISLEQLDGDLHFSPGPFVTVCPAARELHSGEELASGFLPAMWGFMDPNPLDPHISDGKLYLPPGTYRFTAGSSLNVGDNLGENRVELEASVTIRVR